MAFNFSELQQKADRVLHNADEFVRKWIEFVSAPAGTVTLQYYDQNGNLQTVSFSNRNQLVQDFIANVNSAMTKTFYVDQINGNDNNDGSQSAPFQTIAKAVNSIPVGGAGTIYLYKDQTYNISSDIVVKNKFISFKLTGTGTNNPKIVFKSSSDGSYNFNQQFTCIGACNFYFEHIDMEVEQKSDATLPYSSMATGINVSGSSTLGIHLYGCNLTIYGYGLVRARNYGFASVIAWNCSINDVEGAVLNVTNGIGAVVNIGSTITNGRWASGVVKDANGVPRNVLSNIVL